MALLASWFTVQHIRKQIQQSEDHRTDDIKRKNRMQRAGLSIALSEVSKYTENCFQVVWRIKPDSPVDCSELPELPATWLEQIQTVIGSVKVDDSAAIDLEILLSFAQIHFSRHRSLTSTPHQLALEDKNWLLSDSLFLASATHRLFSYSRKNSETGTEWHNETWAINKALEFIPKPDPELIPPYEELKQYIHENWNTKFHGYRTLPSKT